LPTTRRRAPLQARGGGLWTASDNVSIENSIFWGNGAAASQPTDIAIQIGSGITVDVSHSDIEQDGWEGTNGNISEDPVFVGVRIYALTCDSPCLDAGDDSLIATDFPDVDDDGTWNEPSPYDVVGGPREVDAVPNTTYDVDMGAYEGQDDACVGDSNHDGVVDVDDIIDVILNWGSCDTPPFGCAGDVDPAPCGNGTIDTDDLIAVILNWGECDDAFALTPPGEVPQSLQDCWDECAKKYEFGSSEWQTSSRPACRRWRS
jgi:hypothetical protein